MSERKNGRKAPDERGFRALLVLGAVVSIAIGIWGLVWTGMLESVLGFDVPRRNDAFAGIARLYGGTMLAIGIGYALAAAQPHRSRSLLVPLFVVPVITAVSVIAAISREEIATGRGIVFVIYNLAFCLLYFRLYPRLAEPEATPRQPPAPKPPAAP
jgi:ABC-type transport system involved in cytochrome c biogenesis permease component